MYLIMRGKFFEEGRPYRVAKSEKEAIEFLKREGYRKSRSQWNNGLYEAGIDGDSYWTRIEEIEEV